MAKVSYGNFRKDVSPAKSTTYAGIHFRSKREAGYAQKLDILKRNGEIVSWEYEKPIKIFINDKWIFTYKIDFTVTYKNGTIQYIEIKGFETIQWRLKWKIVEAVINKPNHKYNSTITTDAEYGSEMIIIK